MSKKRNQRDIVPYIAIPIALLPIILIIAAVSYFTINSFLKTTSAKSTFENDLPEIVSAMEHYKQLNGRYPGDFRLLKNGLTYTPSDICDGSVNEPVGCAPDGYNYGISTNYNKNFHDTTEPADCGYMIIMNQDAIKGSRIIDAYIKLENSDDIRCADFVERAQFVKSLLDKRAI